MDRGQSDDLSVDPTAEFAYAEETASLKRLARTLVADEATADDVVQEVWLASLDHRPSDFRSHRAWLQAVTRNLAFKAHRKSRRQSDRDRRGARSEALPGADVEVEARSTHRALSDAIDGLGAPYAEVLHMRFFEELKVREIARRIERPEGSVKTYLSRGLNRLRRQLDGEYGSSRAWSLALLGAFDWEAREVPRFAAASAAGVTAAGGVAAWLAHPLAWVAAIVLVGLGAWALWADGAALPHDEAITQVEDAETGADGAPLEVRSNEEDRVRTPDAGPQPVELETTAAPPTVAVDARPKVLFRALDEDGLPLAGAEVWIERNLADPVAKGLTGADGTLLVPIDDGDIDDMLTAPGRTQAEIDIVSGVPQVRLYAFAPGRARSHEFIVPLPNAEPRELVVEFKEPALTLSGVVRNERGQPVENARVRVGDVLFQALPFQDDILRSPGSTVVRTDAQGKFSFAYARPGHQLLHVEAPGHLPARFERDARGTDSVSIDMQVMRALTVRGVVRLAGGEPVAGVEVWAEVNERISVATAVSEADGSFVLDDVPPGTQTIWARDGGAFHMVASTEVSGGPGEERIWDPVLTQQTGVHVLLLGEDGKPLVGWYVYAKTEGSRPWSERRITGLEGGTSIFRDPGVPITMQLFEGNPLQTGEIAPLKTITGLVPKPSPYTLTITAAERASGRLKGVLQDHEGRPLGGIQLYMIAGDFDFFSVVPYDEATGVFDLKRLPPGTYKLRIQSAVAGTLTLPDCEVLANEVTDLGEQRMPVPGRLTISSDWPKEIDGQPVTVLFALYYEQDGQGKYVMLQEGFEPLAGTYDVFPGVYTVGAKVGGKTYQKRSVWVYSGDDVELITKPDAKFLIPLEVEVPAEMGAATAMQLRILYLGTDIHNRAAKQEVVRDGEFPPRADGTFGGQFELGPGLWAIQVGDGVKGWIASTHFTLDDDTLVSTLRLTLAPK